MKIFITGVAGFIGTNIAIYLLKKSKHEVYGIDNIDNYYSKKIKNKRLNELKKYKNFFYKKIDIKDKKLLLNYLKSKKIDLIIHLAAQAGVRYSFVNPSKYIKTNITGFLNLVLCAKKLKINKIIYASSSSVYGNNNNYPISEKNKTSPINIYGISKKLNENIAETYSKISNIKFIGLRFFTIFGEWGRPDMLLFKILKSYFTKEKLYVNNYGNHERDFTYIGDVNKILFKLISKKLKNHEIINICSNNPINILKIIKFFNSKNHLNIKYIKRHNADILKTHGDNSKIKKKIKKLRFTKFQNVADQIFEWYKINKIYRF